MMRGRLKRSGLRPMVGLLLVTLVSLGAVFGAGWSPKLGLDLEGGFSVTLQPVDDVSSDVLDQAIEIIRSRVDGLGVAEPEITRTGDTIEVNLPGVTDRDRARELVGQTAELRFRPVLAELPGNVEDLFEQLTPSDDADDETTTTAGDEATTTTAPDETTTTAAGDEVTGQSTAGAATPLQDTTTTAPAEDPAVEGTTTTVPGDDTTTTTAPATPEDPEDFLSGWRLTAPEDDVADQEVVLPERDDDEVIATYQLGPAVALGEIVQDARASLQPTGEWVVELEIRSSAIDDFNASAAAPCYSMSPICPTGKLAIVLDSEVVMAPTIQQPSYQRDQIVISGALSEGEAKNLALVLRYGSLPVAFEIQQTREVSATLGEDSLRAGVISGLLGLALVGVYMLVVYRLLGLVAIGSLAVSTGLMWVIIAWMGESRNLALTLAGITGIIVSIGVAVDSNVVFYEHLKEEVWRGRSARAAVAASFRSSFVTIVTANMASLIGAVILYVLTVGSVRGFALFLAIGTVLDMVASYFFMRPLVLWLVRHPRLHDKPRALGVATAGGPQS